MPTTKLNLPLIDGTNTADVVRDMNALANAVDNKAGASDGLATLDASGKVPASQLNVSAPADATTSTKGVVQLSNSTASTSETLAATPKAVKDVKDEIDLHEANTSNPHSVTKAQVGLGSVENYAIATQAEAQAGTVTNKYMTPQRTKQAIDSQTGDRSTLNTTAKTTLVAAINELFQFANDGKTKWSSVIGSPLASSDTFTQMQTKTQTIKNTLATNLTNKGQSSTGTETLTALVNKVANVATGKKWASGTALTGGAQLSFTKSDGTSFTRYPLTVTGLDFTPRVILLYRDVGFKSSVPDVVFNRDRIDDNGRSLVSVFSNNMHTILTGNAYANSGTFQVPAYTFADTQFSWFAYE